LAQATLLEFALACDAAAATSSIRAKTAALASYFRSIAEEQDLRRAVRYARGRPFAATDERVLQVGPAAVSEAAMAALGVDGAAYGEAVRRWGEIGQAVASLWHLRKTSPAGEPVTLGDLEAAFAELAGLRSAPERRRIVQNLYLRCRDPREAAYISKIIFGDMRTGVQEGVLISAVAEAFGRPLPQVRRAQLLVGDVDEVAALAQRDQLASAQFRLFHPVQFMLACPVESASEAAQAMAGRAYFCEDKLDGIRAQVHKQHDRLAIYTRTLDRADASFPELLEAMRKLEGEFLLDGEIVPFENGRVLPFARLQRRLGRKALTPRVIRDNPCAFIAFDILYHNGDLLMDQPLRLRRERLVEALAKAGTSLPMVHASCLLTSAGEIEAAFASARDRGNEGLVLKDPESPYAAGRRGRMWLKLKTHLPTLDCVVTAAEYGHGKRRGVLSDYTFAVWDRDPAEPGAALVNIGKAYTGLSDAEIAQMNELFHSLSIGQRGWVHLVQPRMVLEIAFDQVQRSTRHASGYALRFPRIKRIRSDKRPEDADRLARVAEIHASPANTAYAPSKEPEAEKTLFDGT
jgi:DNA ligase-1